MSRKPLGLVLAGGESSRMGRPKATLCLGGKPLWAWAAGALAPACSEVFLAVREGASVEGAKLPRLTDAFSGGPMAAIATGLLQGDVLALACDMPLVPTAFFERLCEDASPAEVVLYGDEQGLQPTAALYRTSFLPAAMEAIRAGSLSLHELIAKRPHALVGPAEVADLSGPGIWFFNINRPADLERAKTYVRRRGVK